MEATLDFLLIILINVCRLRTHTVKSLYTTVLLALISMQTNALTIGTDTNYPPFSSLADQQNHFMGFDIAFMTEICKRIQMPCTFIPVIDTDVKNALVAGTIDLAISAIIIPDKPPTYFLYSLPYLQSYAQFVVNQDSPIKTPADINHQKIGTRTEPVYSDLLRKQLGNDINLITSPSIGYIMDNLRNKKIDLVFTNAPALRYWLASGVGEYRMVGDKIPIGNGYGIMAYQGNEALVQKINQAILEITNDGSYAPIYTRYFSQ